MKRAMITDLVLLSGSFANALALAYVIRRLAHGSWSIPWIAFAALAILSTVLLGTSPFLLSLEGRRKLLLIGSSLWTSLYASEVVLLCVDASPKTARSEVLARADCDHRSPREVLLDLWLQGERAFPTLGGHLFLGRPLRCAGRELIPLGGISRCLTMAGNENGYPMTYEADEFGFGNPIGTWSTKAASVVFLGDSFAQGQCVRSDKGFVSLFREKHPDTFNLGTSGNGPLLELASLKEYASWLEPRWVFWCFFEGNDLEPDLEREKHSALLRRYLERRFTQDIAADQPQIDSCLVGYLRENILRWTGWREDESATGLARGLRSIACLKRLRGTLGLRFASRVDLPLFRRILLEGRETVNAWNGHLVFVYLPAWERYAKPRQAAWFRRAVLETARECGLDVIDLHESFASRTNPTDVFPFGLSGHYNELGHRVVADRLLDYLQSQTQP